MTMDIDPVQETLYNVRNRVPNFLDLFQGWSQRSAAFRDHASAQFDIRYDDTPKGTMDLFKPTEFEDDTLLPLHIFIHGGYWQAMDKADFSYIAEQFVQNGIAVLIVNYDLCPDVTLDHIVEQMRAVVTWAWEKGDTYGLDPHNIHISGHSAGGHLVGELLTTDWQSRGEHPVHPSVIKSAISLSGLFDLTPLVQTTINTNVGLNVTTAQTRSPMGKPCHIHCPVLCAYGGLEGEGFEMQSAKAVEHFTAQGLKAELVKLENATHFDAVDTLADPHSVVFQWALSHIKKAKG
jgi:arylformamidase